MQLMFLKSNNIMMFDDKDLGEQSINQDLQIVEE